LRKLRRVDLTRQFDDRLPVAALGKGDTVLDFSADFRLYRRKIAIV